MRVLFTSHGALGHFHPLVPIARTAARAGHDVVFATPASFAPMVERSGFRAFAAGMSGTPADAFPELLNLGGRDATAFMRARVRPAQASATVTDLLGIADEWRPELLVREKAATFLERLTSGEDLALARQ
jgi:hypothetical protein